MDIKNQVRSLADELKALRRDFHQYPELGCEEYRTADQISIYLADCGIESRRLTPTDVIGLIEGKEKGPTIMLRADMDALPLNETTSHPYKSKHPGKMHACGHDGHLAMLLVATKILARGKNQLKGNIKLVFQPNEEDMYAKYLIDLGVLENPKVDAALGIHLMTALNCSPRAVS